MIWLAPSLFRKRVNTIRVEWFMAGLLQVVELPTSLITVRKTTGVSCAGNPIWIRQI